MKRQMDASPSDKILCDLAQISGGGLFIGMNAERHLAPEVKTEYGQNGFCVSSISAGNEVDVKGLRHSDVDEFLNIVDRCESDAFFDH